MKPSNPSSAINRRVLLSTLATLPALSETLLTASAQAQIAPPGGVLTSWNDGPAKQVFLDFVRDTTDPASPKFVPLEDRIATFDQDGTLWVEHPMYSQMMYCFDRVPVLAAEKPELKNMEPFKTVLSGDREAVLKDIKAIAFDVQGTCVDFYQPLLRVGNKIIEAPAGENVNSSNGSASMSFK